MSEEQEFHPQERKPELRLMPMVTDINGFGSVFGGWIMSQMDIAGGNVAMLAAGGKVTTAAANIDFENPIRVEHCLFLCGGGLAWSNIAQGPGRGIRRARRRRLHGWCGRQHPCERLSLPCSRGRFCIRSRGWEGAQTRTAAPEVKFFTCMKGV